MRWYNFLVGAALWLMAGYAFAEEPKQIIVQATSAEWQFIQQMCEAAKWASRIQFSDGCDGLKARIAAAEEASKKAEAKPEDSQIVPAQ